MGNADPLNLQTGHPVGAGFAEPPTTGHRSSLIVQQAAGEDDIRADARFRQASGATDGTEGIEQHPGSSSLNQQGTVAIAGDPHPALGASEGWGNSGGEQGRSEAPSSRLAQAKTRGG